MKNTITIDTNTPVLKDLHIVIDYLLHQKKIKLTKKMAWFPRKVLFALNEQISQPEKEVTERSDQYRYPKLHFLYHILISGQLFRKAAVRSGAELQPDEERLNAFKKLTPAEQYLFVVQMFWMYCSWQNLQLDDRPQMPLIGMVDNDFQQLAKLPSGKNLDISYGGEYNMLLGLNTSKACALYFEYLGWCQMKLNERMLEYSPRYIRYDSVTLTDFGHPFFEALGNHRPLSLWNRPYRYYYEGEYGAILGMEMDWDILDEASSREEANKIKMEWQAKVPAFLEAFKPLFPAGELEHSLDISTLLVQPGVYTFKVALEHDSKIWRRIALNGSDTLDALHDMIQQAFQFDNDHLYAFYLEGDDSMPSFSGSPMGAMDGLDSPFAGDAYLDELGLIVGTSFIYLFDFGDSWRFIVTLEKIDAEAKELKKYTILKEHGKAPQQYPDWDDEDEW